MIDKMFLQRYCITKQSTVLTMGPIIYILLSICYLHGVSAGQKGCPDVDPRNETIIIGIPTECYGYYMCDNGKAVFTQCPLGTVFDLKLKLCNWPEKANRTCDEVSTEFSNPTDYGGTTFVTGFEPTDLTSTPCTPPSVKCRHEGPFLIPFPGDCTKFYMCDNGVPKEKLCPPTLYFNPTLMVCDWPANSGCK